MARVTGPLLSLRAGGSIAKSQVYAEWKGVPYVRQHVVPTYSNSGEQQKTRGVFREMMQLYKAFPTIARAPWMAYIAGKALTERNAFASFNVRSLREESDMLQFIASPGANGGVAIESVTPSASGGAGTADLAVTAPAAPTGWTLFKVQGVAIRNTDPHSPILPPIVAVEENSPQAGTTNTLNFTGLAPNVDYLLAAWLVWDKGVAKKGYSVSMADHITSAQ